MDLTYTPDEEAFRLRVRGWIAENRPKSARPGAEVSISLTSLPADYDLVLLADPRVAAGRSDDVYMGNISDIDQRAVDQRAVDQRAVDQRAVGAITGSSTNPGTADETVQAFLSRGGRYFILIYGVNGGFDAARAYRGIEDFLHRVRVRVGAVLPGDWTPAFGAALDDDLSVPIALAEVHAARAEGNRALNAGEHEAAMAQARIKSVLGRPMIRAR